MLSEVDKALSKLQERRQNQGPSQFVTENDLKEVWNQDFLNTFFSNLGADLSDDEYRVIRDESIKMLSILVAIGWKDWVYAKAWLTVLVPRLDDSILPLDKAYLERIPGLSVRDIDNFCLRQHEYNPIVIKENVASEYLSGQILPITETSRVIGSGAYGDVVKIQVAKKQFQDANGNRNEEPQVFALKTLKIPKEGKDPEEAKNLQLLKHNRKTDAGISTHKAIFIYNGLYHILYDLAEANFREFLEEEQFERYLRPIDCIHPLFEATWELSDALSFLHTELEVGRVKYICCHMDLKPENILVFIKDEKFSLKIADFGISRIKPNPHAQGAEIGHAHSYQSSSTTGTMPRRGPWEFAAPEMRGKRVGRKIDVWALGCILVMITIRAFKGRKCLERFDNSKGDKSGRYKDDQFHHRITRFFSEAHELKPEVNKWLNSLSHGDDGYLGPLEELGLGKGAKEILSKLHSLIRACLEIDSKVRITSAKLADDLYMIKDGIPSPFDRLKMENTLDNAVGRAPDILLHMLSGRGLRLYELCAKSCLLNGMCSFNLIQSQFGLLYNESTILQACSLVSGSRISKRPLSYHETCAVVFLIHLHTCKRIDIMLIAGFADSTREVFKRFAKWISCNCGSCDTKWNFASSMSISKESIYVGSRECKAKAFKKNQLQISGDYTKSMWEYLKEDWRRGI